MCIINYLFTQNFASCSNIVFVEIFCVFKNTILKPHIKFYLCLNETPQSSLWKFFGILALNWKSSRLKFSLTGSDEKCELAVAMQHFLLLSSYIIKKPYRNVRNVHKEIWREMPNFPNLQRWCHAQEKMENQLISIFSVFPKHCASMRQTVDLQNVRKLNIVTKFLGWNF